MHPKVLLVAYAAAFSSLVAAEVDRPKFYFPRQVKRQIWNNASVPRTTPATTELKTPQSEFLPFTTTKRTLDSTTDGSSLTSGESTNRRDTTTEGGTTPGDGNSSPTSSSDRTTTIVISSTVYVGESGQPLTSDGTGLPTTVPDTSLPTTTTNTTLPTTTTNTTLPATTLEGPTTTTLTTPAGTAGTTPGSQISIVVPSIALPTTEPSLPITLSLPLSSLLSSGGIIFGPSGVLSDPTLPTPSLPGSTVISVPTDLSSTTTPSTDLSSTTTPSTDLSSTTTPSTDLSPTTTPPTVLSPTTTSPTDLSSTVITSTNPSFPLGIALPTDLSLPVVILPTDSSTTSSTPVTTDPVTPTAPQGIPSTILPSSVLSDLSSIISDIPVSSPVVTPPETGSLPAPTFPSSVLIVQPTGSLPVIVPATTGSDLLPTDTSVSTPSGSTTTPTDTSGASPTATDTSGSPTTTDTSGASPTTTATDSGSSPTITDGITTSGVSTISSNAPSITPGLGESNGTATVITVPSSTPTDVYASIPTSAAASVEPSTTGTSIATTGAPDTSVQSWLPASVVVQPSAASSVAPAGSGIPTSLPQFISPSGDVKPIPEGQTLIQIGFTYGLNYDFVVSNLIAASQIFEYLPKGLAYALNIDKDNITMQSLVPYDTQPTLGYITTLAKVSIPSNTVQELQLELRTPLSRLYSQKTKLLTDFMHLINPTIPLIPGTTMPDSPSTGTYGAPTPTASTGNKDGGIFTASSQDASPNKGPIVGIVFGTVTVASAYGAAMFFVARRYKRRKSGHRRVSSIGSPEMRHSGSPFMGGALMAGGRVTPGLGNGRDSRGSGRSGGNSARTAQISAPMMAENSLGWN